MSRATVAERGLPANTDAEKFILGSILLDGSRFASVAGAITEDKFALQKHRCIWARISDLAERGENIDRVTLADELMRRGELESVDGLTYLTSLDDGLPHIPNLDSYVRIIIEKHRLRRAIFAAQRTMTQALSGEFTADQVCLDGQAMLAEETGGYGGSNIESAADFVGSYPGGINLFLNPAQQNPGIPTGFHAIDELCDGFHAGEIFVVGARPSHGKTAYGACVAKNVARAGHAVAVFTAELSKTMWTHRCVCEEAEVSYSRFRRGEVTEEERIRLREATQVVMEMPLYIDDSSGLRIADIRVQVNRILRTRPVSLLVVDYAQLLRPPKGQRFGTENDKFTAIGEEIKTLTKQTGIPMLLLSQLNRDSEKDKGDSRPKLAQARGCLTADTLLWDVKTGCPKAIVDIREGDIVAAIGADQKVGPYEVRGQWSTGIKPVFDITTTQGKRVIATANHPFLTEEGWKPLSELRPGDHIASAWRLPDMGGNSSGVIDDLCRLLGYFAGDGSCLHRKTATFTNTEPELIRDCADIGSKYFPGVEVKWEVFCRNHKPWYEIDFLTDKGTGHWGTNDLRNWFRKVGTYDKIHNKKFVSNYVFASGPSGAAHFLAGYFASDGCVKFRKCGGMVIHCDSVSYALCRDVTLLLSKLGIVAKIGPPTTKKNPRCQKMYRVTVTENQENHRLFHALIPLRGAKKVRLDHGIATMSEKINKAGVFGLPNKLSYDLARTTHWEWKDQKKRMQRGTALLWADRINDANLRMWATSDVLWEKIKSIQYRGEEEVFDICVPGAENFIANGLVAHNSGVWEEIAFVGATLYREYLRKRERDDLREVAEFIIEKNRSGPVGSPRLRFQPWLMRFSSQEADIPHAAAPPPPVRDPSTSEQADIPEYEQGV